MARPARGWPIDPYIGRLVDGKYRIEKRLGAGGFGAVFRATQIHGNTSLGQVVLKFLLGEVAENPSIRQRFVNEARAARQLTSPHVVKVFDLGFDEDGAPFMAMEYLTGVSLGDHLERYRRLPAAEALDAAAQIAEAMEECHDKGVLHRDLKPDNILLVPQKAGHFVKILDFGIARVPTPDAKTTATLMGTPRYMPPEQLLQQHVDAGVDIYALGVILFEMLAGEPPIVAKTPMEYIHLNLSAPPRKLTDVVPGMPPPLVDLVDRMLAKERDRRPASMGEVHRTLMQVADTSGWTRGRIMATPPPELVSAAAMRAAATSETIRTPGAATQAAAATMVDRPRRRRLVVGVAIAVALAALVAVVAIRRPAETASAPPRTAASAAPVPAPAPPPAASPPGPTDRPGAAGDSLPNVTAASSSTATPARAGAARGGPAPGARRPAKAREDFFPPPPE